MIESGWYCLFYIIINQSIAISFELNKVKFIFINNGLALHHYLAARPMMKYMMDQSRPDSYRTSTGYVDGVVLKIEE